MAFVCAAAGAFLALRNSGLYPSVFADEYLYSLCARHLSFCEAPRPNYLYYLVYGLTTWCGFDWLACARGLNVLCWCGGVWCIYSAFRRRLGNQLAILVAAISAFSPASVYTAFFMPEAANFLSFWVLLLLLLNTPLPASRLNVVIVGAALGISSLVKPQSLFLVPVVGCYLAVESWRANGAGVAAALGICGLLAASTMATKYAVGFLLAGEAGLALFGADYGQYADRAVDPTAYPVGFWKSIVHVFSAHLLGIACINAVGLACAIEAIPAFFRKDSSSARCRLSLLTCMSLGVLAVVTVLFSTSIASIPGQDIGRVHMRYYSFAIPLLSLCCASCIAEDLPGSHMTRRVCVGLLLVGGVTAAQMYGFRGYALNIVDCPELYGLVTRPKLFGAIVAMAILSLGVWMWNPKAGCRVALYAYVPLAAVISLGIANLELNNRRHAATSDRVGLFATAYLADEEQARVHVVGTNPMDVYHVLFHLDKKEASAEVLAPSLDYDVRKCPADKEWLILLADVEATGEIAFAVRRNGFSLVRLMRPYQICFSRDFHGGAIIRSSGLSSVEPWGTWTVGDSAQLEFAAHLPSRFTLKIEAAAYGPNIDRPFRVVVGDTQAALTFTGDFTQQEIEVSAQQSSAVLKIEVPHPESPRHLEGRDDTRKLGLAIKKLQIIPR